MIVPVICAWIEQWYVYVPEVSNVNEKWFPGVITPELKTPVSEVAV
jgi:hypothetical protein